MRLLPRLRPASETAVLELLDVCISDVSHGADSTLAFGGRRSLPPLGPGVGRGIDCGGSSDLRRCDCRICVTTSARAKSPDIDPIDARLCAGRTGSDVRLQSCG